MVKQLIMKIGKRFILLVLVSSLFLVACEDDGGFSIAKHDDEQQEPENNMGDRIEKEDDVIANSGSTGTKDDNEEPENQETNPTIIPSTDEVDNGTQTIVNIGNQVIPFNIYFEVSSEANYINVSYSEDPFDKKYDFSYYTINDQKLDNSNYCFKETINEKDTYKIYVGSSESGNYVIKFYNSSGVQYGKAYVSVKLNSQINSPTYMSMAFNLIKVRFVSISFSIQNVFKKIGNFFANLFGRDHISL